jgi:hypothetical protein
MILSALLFVIFYTDDTPTYHPAVAFSLWNAKGVRPGKPSTQPRGIREVEEEEVEHLDVRQSLIQTICINYILGYLFTFM